MPQTVNGIGTTYYGKKNLRKSVGVCDHCGRQVEFQTYETRLWFVIFFIPIIPLGRKQILDYCPKCTWHRAIPIDEWARVKDKAVQEAGAEAAKDPTNPEAAIELLGTLIAFHKDEEARRLAEIMARRFPDHADVQLQLGAWHDSEGRGAEADACFARAFKLDPANAGARRAVAIGCIERGELDRAAELLAAMTDEQAREHVAAFFLLASSHQKRGNHQAAMAVFRQILTRGPALVKDKAFCKAVRVSEKALGQEGSLVPKPWLTPPRMAVGGAAAAVLVVLIAVAAFRGAARRTLHIVNRLGAPVTVTLDGGPSWTVPSGEREAVSARKGRHRAVIRTEQGAEETVDVELGGRKDAYVLNPGSAAAFVVEERPYGTGTAEPSYRIHSGKPFFAFPRIDYAFKDFPSSVPGREGATVWKRGVSVIEAEPLLLLIVLRHVVPDEDLIQLAEHGLTRKPGEEGLLGRYLRLCATTENMPRARDFLAKGLERRPVEVPWHRAYQNVCEMLGEHPALLARYDRLLADAHEDAALLHLRGRLALTHVEGMGYYARALAADRKNGYAWLGKAYRLTLVGDFEEARKASEEACRLLPEEDEAAELLFALRVDAGEAEALEAELRKKLEEEPLDWHAAAKLARLLAARGDLQAVKTTYEGQIRGIQEALQEGAADLVLDVQLQMAYQTGDVAATIRDARQLKDPVERSYTLFHAHIEQGSPAEAEKLLDQIPPWRKGYANLLLAMAWTQRGDATRADARWNDAAAAFAARGGREQLVADLLRKGDALRMADLDDLGTGHADKAAILVALADRCPALRRDLLPLAKRLNYSGSFPSRFLARRIAALEK